MRPLRFFEMMPFPVFTFRDDAVPFEMMPFPVLTVLRDDAVPFVHV
jgi:hypothetical protein